MVGVASVSRMIARPGETRYTSLFFDDCVHTDAEVVGYGELAFGLMKIRVAGYLSGVFRGNVDHVPLALAQRVQQLLCLRVCGHPRVRQ